MFVLIHRGWDTKKRTHVEVTGRIFLLELTVGVSGFAGLSIWQGMGEVMRKVIRGWSSAKSMSWSLVKYRL